MRPLVFLAALCLATTAQAHALDLGALWLEVDGERIEERLALHPAAWASLLGPELASLDERDERDLAAYLPAAFASTLGASPLQADGGACSLAPAAVRAERGQIVLTARGQCPAGARSYRQRLAFLSALPETQKIVVSASLDGAGFERAADRLTQTVIVERGQRPGLLGFVALGVEHIFTGYDHLLFLLGLLLAGGGLRRVLWMVTSFTLAHSVTLALAALSVVVLPARLVESAIAASIVVIALLNVFERGAERRWMLAFAFGLLHGFGFASALADLQLSRSGLAGALFGFNLGVELGQAVLVAGLVPLLALLRRRTPYAARLELALSLASLAFGAYWFVERAIPGEAWARWL